MIGHTAALLVVFAAASGCGTSPPAPAAADAASALPADASSADAEAEDDAAQQWKATLTASDAVDLFYSQGVARIPDGWIFSAAGALWRTDDAFVQLAERDVPLPGELTALGFNHIGGIDFAEGMLYAAVEQHDFSRNEQAVVRFDPQTLDYVDHVLLAQHEASFMAVDEPTMTAYLSDRYSDDTLLRYDIKAGWKPLASLPMSQKVEHIQGGDIAQGAIWLSCDDPVQGIYRVDLASGAVVQVGSVNRQEKVGDFRPEVEGIDASQLSSGLLHVLTGEPLKLTSWLDHFEVAAPN